MANYFDPSFDGSVNYPTTEHYLRRVLVGNVEAVRHRLYGVLERLDYDFINENEFEIEARRDARGWATAYSSADVLDYPRTLIIKLKPLSESSTHASFAYTIKHPSLQRGEKEVLTREAETIATLATVRAMDRICAVCGMESDNNSRFCRKCGTPMTGDETAIEILRMTAEIRSGYTSVVSSTILVGIAALITLAALILLLTGNIDKGISVISVLLSISVALGFLNVLFLGFGWNRMRNALKSKSNEQKTSYQYVKKTLSVEENAALPPAPISFSVTDNTTELFDENQKNYEFVRRDKVVTNDLER
ncbi:MAG TPA: zinc ribbon domain-containing protein [Pyrinomonadaceae bacterium]|nr:zinc ribbon domain-containing protein [Pyrinomonadaceae bacterium]